MSLPENAFKLTLYIGEEQKHGRKPLFEAITMEARKRGIAGATVTRGLMGYGANSRIRSSKVLILSEDLPMVVEMVDTEENLRTLAKDFRESVGNGLVTLEPVHVLNYHKVTR